MAARVASRKSVRDPGGSSCPCPLFTQATKEFGRCCGELVGGGDVGLAPRRKSRHQTNGYNAGAGNLRRATQTSPDGRRGNAGQNDTPTATAPRVSNAAAALMTATRSAKSWASRLRSGGNQNQQGQTPASSSAQAPSPSPSRGFGIGRMFSMGRTASSAAGGQVGRQKSGVQIQKQREPAAQKHPPGQAPPAQSSNAWVRTDAASKPIGSDGGSSNGWWARGAIAVHNGRIAKLLDAPDEYNEVKLEYADGTQAGGVQVATLVQGTERQWSAAKLKKDWSRGTIVMHQGRVAKVLQEPNEWGEIALEYADGGGKNGVPIHELQVASQQQWDEAEGKLQGHSNRKKRNKAAPEQDGDAIRRERSVRFGPEVLTITLQPGELGLSRTFNAVSGEENEVSEVYPDGQADQAGIEAGMIFHEIDGRPFSEQFLMDCIEGEEPYTVMFTRSSNEAQRVQR
eukprot:TRINITY_DN31265_c0_g1_i1.p1 TRINITY_DN31265_c0_g1~~TRINITY_DN31265_c0_g1_i1.p1  ORF type:complete len:456 (+),score=101.80 TRINITY_DN31265_c0_g1_i1:170-1537(+)